MKQLFCFVLFSFSFLYASVYAETPTPTPYVKVLYIKDGTAYLEFTRYGIGRTYFLLHNGIRTTINEDESLVPGDDLRIVYPFKGIDSQATVVATAYSLGISAIDAAGCIINLPTPNLTPGQPFPITNIHSPVPVQTININPTQVADLKGVAPMGTPFPVETIIIDPTQIADLKLPTVIFPTVIPFETPLRAMATVIEVMATQAIAQVPSPQFTQVPTSVAIESQATVIADTHTKTFNSYTTFYNAEGTPESLTFTNGKPRVSSQPYMQDIAEGNVPSHAPFRNMGINGDVGTGQETIWELGGQYVFPAAPIQMEVLSSDNTDDFPGGIGCWAVEIMYLDGDYAEHTEYLNLSGTAAQVTIAEDIFRVNDFRVYQSDGNGYPVGNITLRGIGGGTIYNYITLGYTRSRSTVYTVPASKTVYITNMTLSATGSKFVRFTTQCTYDTARGVTTTPGILFFPYHEVYLLNTALPEHFEMPFRVPAYTDMKVSAISDGSASFCSVYYSGWIEEDTP